MNTTVAQTDKKAQNKKRYAAWRKANPEYMINYRIDNAEKISAKNHEYYIKHRKQILHDYSLPCTCECGATMRRNNIPRHYKSKKHQEYIKQKTSSGKHEQQQEQSVSPTISSD